MKNKQADLLGITSAVLCIIYCLLVPILVVFGTINDSLAEQWEYLDLGFILLSGLAVYMATRHEGNRHEGDRRGYSGHKHNRRLSQQMWATWLVFTVALLLHDLWPPALYISVLSSVGLALLHFRHFRKKHIAVAAK
ncbi:MAG: MerC domain-containing protein [Bacteroidota bacterium]